MKCNDHFTISVWGTHIRIRTISLAPFFLLMWHLWVHHSFNVTKQVNKQKFCSIRDHRNISSETIREVAYTDGYYILVLKLWTENISLKQLLSNTRYPTPVSMCTISFLHVTSSLMCSSLEGRHLLLHCVWYCTETMTILGVLV